VSELMSKYPGVAAAVEQLGQERATGELNQRLAQFVVMEELAKVFRAEKRQIIEAAVQAGLTWPEIAGLVGKNSKVLWDRYAVTENSTPEERAARVAAHQRGGPRTELEGLSVGETAERLGISAVRLYREIERNPDATWWIEQATGLGKRVLKRIVDFDLASAAVHAPRHNRK